ncbi:MAG TPA: hypothetical protein VEW28_08700 [Candidatus Kapabacteria bacterium]|nr:hypothetical protein [Candidatus Kapabacteria bacterium]
MTDQTIISDAARTKSDRVLQWLFEQHPAEAEDHNLARLFDDTVLSKSVQGFLRTFVTEHKLYNGNECKEIVSEAHLFSARYLATPNEFLSEYFARETSANALKKLDAFQDYPYYREFIEEWLPHNSTILSKEDVRNFVWNADKLFVIYSPVETIEKNLEPFFDFFKELDNATDGLGRVTELFITDKGLDYSLAGKDGLHSAAALADFLKTNISHAIFSPASSSADASTQHSDAEYQEFLDELRTAGIHLPPPPHMREGAKQFDLLPVHFFVNEKLREQTTGKIFHGNPHEYDRLIAIIDNAANYEEAILNLETIMHLQRPTNSPKLFDKWANVIKMKFAQPERDAIR